MTKKSYPIETETLILVTPPNETYNGKEIPHTLLTTAGEFDHSGQLLKIANSKGKKNKKNLNFISMKKTEHQTQVTTPKPISSTSSEKSLPIYTMDDLEQAALEDPNICLYYGDSLCTS
jgi:hypothetical protein